MPRSARPNDRSMAVSGPAERLLGDALDHWLAMGLDAGVDRMGARLGTTLRADLDGVPHPDAAYARSEGWGQVFHGTVAGEVQLLTTRAEEAELLRSMVAASPGPLEPSRELGAEFSNLVLNGVLMTLCRALQMRVRARLPRRTTSRTGADVAQRQFVVRWTHRSTRGALRLALEPSDVEVFGRHLRRSLPQFMEALAWAS